MPADAEVISHPASLPLHPHLPPNPRDHQSGFWLLWAHHRSHSHRYRPSVHNRTSLYGGARSRRCGQNIACREHRIRTRGIYDSTRKNKPERGSTPRGSLSTSTEGITRENKAYVPAADTFSKASGIRQHTPRMGKVGIVNESMN